MSRVVRLTLSYDGTELAGWQRQKNARSVQEELEKALALVHGKPVATVGAGRTDAGVHAMGQVAHFRTDIASMPAGRFVPALNKSLPRDIRVLAAAEAHPDFHARYDARLRRYRYFILPSATGDPFRLRYAWRVSRRPDAARLDALAAPLLGERDFTAFASARDTSLSRCRFVHEASFRWEGDCLVFQVAANAFLWRMVRSLVGSLIAWEAEGAGPGRVLEALETRDRRLAGPTAPPQGLFLWNVEYYASPTRPGRGSAPGAGEGTEAGDADEGGGD